VWTANRVSELLGVRYPIVQAPMAGFTTPELVAAVSNGGGLGSLGAALLAPGALRAAIDDVRRLTDRPFGVNLFVALEPPQASEEAIAAMSEALEPYRAELGLAEPEQGPSPPPPGLADAQLAVVAEARVPVFSFTFGIPPLAAVKEAGCVVLGTATTVAEAVELERAGVDIVVAQGVEAGGHRGTFLGQLERGLVGGLALVPQMVDRIGPPVIAAGGIMDGRGIAAALALGAEGVQLGTAFLSCQESSTPRPHAEALAEAGDESTVVTPVYSGRPARTIRTALIDALERSGLEPLPFPLQAGLLAEIRGAAAEQGRPDLMFLLAGQAAALSRALPAGELVETLVRETEDVLRRLGS
jgi:nitronate monooxygenase